MEPTVLAGAIEFSPAEIAAIVAVLVALFLAVTAPGWLVLAHAAGRRPAPSPRSWPRTVGGGLLGLGISGATAAFFGALGSEGVWFGIVAGWGVCWILAALLRKRAAAQSPSTAQGWGR
jgi:hypothetical protein